MIHFLLHVFRKHPLQVVCVCGARWGKMEKTSLFSGGWRTMGYLDGLKTKIPDLHIVRPVVMTAR